MGSVVLSIDAELGWGFHDLASPPARRVERARWGWQALVDLLEEYRVPATWAIVGHLFLDDCNRKHPTLPTPPGWFNREREEWRDRPDLRFGPELVDAVVDSKVDHEIACHTFSHVIFSDENTTKDLARAEIREAHRAMGDLADESSSFVFPRNRVAHRDVLAEMGYSSYRGLGRRHTHRLGSSIGKMVRSTIGNPGLVEPTVDEYGLVNIPSSMYLFGFEGISRRLVRTVGEDPIVRHARRGIDAVAEDDTDEVFHMWLHPNNLTEPTDVDRVRSVLELLEYKREEQDIPVETMKEVADRTLQMNSVSPTV